MKKWMKPFIYYLILVLLPTCIFLFFYWDYRYDVEKGKQWEHAKWVASIHKNQIDQFIGETEASLEILSLTINPIDGNKEDIQATLEQAAEKDPRYGGLLVVDPNGTVLRSTTHENAFVTYQNKEYFQTLLKTKRTVVSPQPEYFPKGQLVFAVAAPIIQSNNVIGAVIAHIRIDYLQNIINILTPEEDVQIVYHNNQIIHSSAKETVVSIVLENIPWQIVVESELSLSDVNKSTIFYGLCVFTCLHILYLISQNIYIKRQAQKERIQNEAQKLELIGTLAASTAHEIRNPLTGIQGLVQLLSEKYRDPQDQFYFSVIHKEIDRINQIVSEFLILGKPTIQKVETIDLRKIITDINPIIRSEANLYNIIYNFKMPAEHVLVKCTKDQMKQVILNITRNAFEAMDAGGTLNLELEKWSDHCTITIQDSGVGIPKDQLDKIFEPFFTSKECGTGLGLVVCKRIIQSFNGVISIESEEGRGTIVTISLPLEKSKND
ncbi:ATP-binding protein [Aeribacillus pallidus]|uniref:ATP-binding protein n=1 Tax=Aeribacillus pallidus TaxID=33936 RepID=UPI003D1F6A30